MVDSIFVPLNMHLPDTLKILVHSSKQSGLPVEYIGGIFALLGVIITLVGGWWSGLYIARKQANIEIQKELFKQRLTVYLKLSEMLWEGYSVFLQKGEDGIFPQSYKSLELLRAWLNGLVQTFDKNLMLLDQDTYRNFDALNQVLLRDINEIEKLGGSEINARSVGRQSVSEVQNKVQSILSSIRSYLKKQYPIDLEEVK